MAEIGQAEATIGQAEATISRSASIGQIYCFQPAYGNVHPDSARAFWAGTSLPGGLCHGKEVKRSKGGSLLGQLFNQAWCSALNLQEAGEPITHFAMLHSDVVPDDGWLDILMQELLTFEADLIATVVPLKEPMGATSTAIDDPCDPWVVERRITMREAYKLPLTFTAEDCGYPNRYLLANTGCWLANLNSPIYKQVDDNGHLKVFFTIDDAIIRGPNNQWTALNMSEDWNFSRKVQSLGGKVVVTRKVGLVHEGNIPYNNREPWGMWQEDMALINKFAGKHMPTHRNVEPSPNGASGVQASATQVEASATGVQTWTPMCMYKELLPKGA